PCGCGEVGCLETLVGGRYIEARVAADLASGRAADLARFLESQGEMPDLVTPSDVDCAARHGVGYAEALWDEVSSALARMLSGCLSLINPSGLLLGGGVLLGCESLRARIAADLERMTVAAVWRDVKLLTPELGD